MNASDQEQRLDEIIADYLEALEAGQAPTRAELLRRHPDLAAELAAFFADQDQFDSLVQPLRQTVAGPADTPLARPPLPLLEGDAAARTAAAPVAFGEYELLAVIARGGMGVVYRARQVRLGRLVALKMIRAGEFAGREEVERFRLEATAAASLEHPHIVPIYEVGEHEQRHFYTMKLVTGGSLARSVQRGAWSPLTADRQHHAARLMAQVARAVQHAHERGILHRDLKPSNILLEPAEGHVPGEATEVLPESAIALVADFGLAKRLTPGAGDATATPTGMVIGTPGYLAPEQAGGRAGELTTAADIYGIGTILYTLLTGRPPFQGSTSLETLLQARERDPVPPRDLAAGIHLDLQTICLQCLQQQPAQRYASAAALAEDLERYLRGEPVRARPVSGWEYLWRWCRRKPLVAGLAAALVLAVVGGFGLVAWQWQRAERHARRAQENLAEAEDSLRLAHEAVNTLYTRVSEERLRDLPGTQQARKELLEVALGYYGKFIQKRGQDPALRAEMAETYFRIGTITQEIGSNDAARRAYDEARSLYQTLLEAAPTATDVERSLAETQRRIGILHSGASRWKEALAAYQQAHDHFARVLQAHPDDAGARYGLAAVANNLGNGYRQQGQTKEALAEFEKARTILEQLLQADPRSRQFRGALSATFSNLAMTSSALGRRAEAVTFYRQAAGLLEKLVEEAPANVAARKDLARAYRLLGGPLLRDGQSAEALRLLRRAQDLLEALARENPGLKEVQVDLAANHRQLGHILRDGGRRDEALAHYRAGRDLMEKVVQIDPAVPGYRNDLAKCCYDMAGILSNSGRSRDALPLYQRACDLRAELVAANPDNVELRADLTSTMYNLAVVHWNLGRPAEALAILRRGIEQKVLVCERAPHVARYRRELDELRAKLARWEQAAGDRPKE